MGKGEREGGSRNEWKIKSIEKEGVRHEMQCEGGKKMIREEEEKEEYKK